jgi:AcrR family transcriptional regulator
MDLMSGQAGSDADIWPLRPAEGAVTDGRLVRGVRTRRTIANHAIDIASLEGLSGLSFGRLATDLGLSKSGIQTLFGTKENLQLATVAAAGELFADAVVQPARAARPGIARLSALVDHWIVYAETPLFAGGCFWAANLVDFDSRPGQIRDALLDHHTAWLALIARELRYALDTGEVADLDIDLAAFQIDAVLLATNTALRLGDPGAVKRARQVIESLLTPRR